MTEEKQEVSEENKDVFDEVSPTDEVVMEKGAEAPTAAPLEEKQVEYEMEELSDSEKFDIKLSEEDEAVEDKETKKLVCKEFEIEHIELGKPMTENAPEVSETGKQFFKTKLKVKYKDTNYMSLLPNIKWYVNDRGGKKVLNPWFGTSGLTEKSLDDPFIAEVSKLYYRYCIKAGAEVGKITAKEFVEALVGMKVKLKTTTGKYKGKNWSRIDIHSF